MDELAERKCTACSKQTPPLRPDQEQALHEQVPAWTLRDHRLQRRFTFGDFPSAIRFVDRMAEIAEDEGHHPLFAVDYDKVDVTLWTHAIGALSENDFILAAKLDRAANALPASH
jgi:4a-hydroxytetrahydrobiopterin dehydratase